MTEKPSNPTEVSPEDLRLLKWMLIAPFFGLLIAVGHHLAVRLL